jgi:hypothetical protein
VTPRVLCYTPTYGDALRPETVKSVGMQQWSGRMMHVIGRHNPHPAPDLRNVAAQFMLARDKALLDGYDALWCVEHDMIIPSDALGKLWDTGAAVAYGVYMLRHTYVVNARKLGAGHGQSFSTDPDALADAIRCEVVPVNGVGCGCTLVRRDALERVPFRMEDGVTVDVTFAADCREAGVAQVAHFGVLCGHIHNNVALWPLRDPESGLVQGVSV